MSRGKTALGNKNQAQALKIQLKVVDPSESNKLKEGKLEQVKAKPGK